MRMLFTVVVALFLAGCAAKIVPGKVSETTIKATPDMAMEPQPEEIKADVYQNVESVPETGEQAVEQSATQESELSQEDNVTAEEEKPRFPRSELIKSIPSKVTMKTKKFAFSDTGFMNLYDNMINLQVFSMGKAVLDMTVSLNDDEICVGSLCNTKHGFNQTFLTGEYPDTLVENILQSKPIMGGKNLKKMTKGFIQKIMTAEYGIKYKIWPGNVYFKDVKNNIIIKIRKLLDE